MQKFPYKIIDLTHTLEPHIPTWSGDCGFNHHLVHDYDLAVQVPFRGCSMEMYAGIGTHLDAPAHCVPGGATVDQLLLSDLVAPCVVIDVSQSAHERYSLSVADIAEFERQHGMIQAGCFVFVHTGWSKFWSQPEHYRNNLVFPAVSAEAAQVLLEREVVGLGIDTLSPDRAEDGFPVHGLFLGAGKYLVENATNLEQLSVIGSYVLVLPIKIKGGTEAPIRLIAFTGI
ncbi:MAG: cyclase family protein [Pseudomonadota bacterium]